MRVLFAVCSGQTQTVSLRECVGKPLLMFFSAPAIAQEQDNIAAIPPDSLLLYTIDEAFMQSSLPTQAAFAVCFDPQDEPWQEQLAASLPEQKPLLLSAADPRPGAEHLQQLGDLLAKMTADAVPETVSTHLLCALLQACGAVAGCRLRDEEQRHNRARLIALRQNIYLQPARTWSIEQMCAEVSVSRTHLHRIYQETFRVACHTDVLHSRLLHARMLLRQTNESIREIALACGFENDITFMRAFKKHLGCTPTTFRMQSSTSSECTRNAF